MHKWYSSHEEENNEGEPRCRSPITKLSIQQYFNMVIKFQEQGIEISPNGPTDPGQKKKFRPQKPLKLLDHM